MKISAVISSDIIKKEAFLKDKLLYFEFILIALAIVSGIALYMSFEEYLTKEICGSFISFFTDFSTKSKIEVFSGLMLAHLPYITLMIIFGTSSAGMIFILVVSFIKAVGLGTLTACLYSTFGLKGVEYSLLIFLPGKFIVLFSIIFMMNVCVYNSLYVNKLIKGECKAENRSNMFAVKIVTSVIMFVIASLVDCILAVSFSSLFSF